MTKYFSANEAREAVIEATSLTGQYLQKETETILDRIKDLSTKGFSCMTEFKPVDVIVIRRLQELGYVVNVTDDQRDGYDCKIGW